ncbi:MAG: tetratricopeptide repeat protein [Planctomycetota bacterium]|nr:tetratricopeptide repeat protein [Planctomycetota bacterium]
MDQTQNNRYVFLVYAGLVIATFIAFEPLRHNGFVNYDDYDYVTDNSQVTGGITGKSILRAFTTPHVGNWLPLTWLSFMLDYQLFGLNPSWMHFVNLLLHVANTLLLFTILTKITGALWPSAFVAAAFALHPMHVESVAWITERKDVLSTLFYMLTLTAYAGYVRRHNLFRYLLTILLFALGLLAKPMLVTLPFVLLLLDYWPLKRFSIADSRLPIEKNPKSKIQNLKFAKSFGRLIIEKIPLFALAVVSGVITFLVQRSSGAVPDVNILPLQSRVANAFLSYATYISKMFWPQNLTAFYPLDADSIQFWRFALCVLLLLAISIFVISFGRRQRYLPVGWFWFVGTLIPVIGLIQSGAQALAERYTYIPYIGLFIMIAWGVAELSAGWRYRKIILAAASCIVLAIILTCTRQQVRYWKNSFTLSEHAIEVTKNCSVMHVNLAVALSEQGRLEDAAIHLKEALRAKPKYFYARFNLGLVCLKQGNFNEAISNLTQADILKHNEPQLYYYLAIAYDHLGKSELAIQNYTRAIKIKSDYPEAYNGIGKMFLMQGKFDKAAENFEEVLRIRNDWPDTYENLALAYSQLNKYGLAVANWKNGLKLDPNSADTFNNLAWILAVAEDAKINNPAQAIGYAQRACELTKFNDPGFLDTLAVSYAAAGKFSVAVETAQKAMDKANLAGKKDLAEEISARLKLYQAGQPYIESAAKTPISARQSDSNAAP